MQRYLPANVPDFSQASILVVGDIMLDRYWFGDTARISPEAPVPIVHIAHTDHRPGGAGNVALNLAALGAPVTLLGQTGQDDAADILAQRLYAAGVTCDFERSANLATIIKLRVISRNQQLVRLDFEEKIAALDNQALLTKYKQQLAKTSLVILSDYNKGTLQDPQQFIQLARAASVPILVDPKSTDFSCYKEANLITPNFKEFEAVVGKCNSEQDILEKGQALLAKHKFAALLITRGNEGMTLVDADGALHMPAYAREVLDVTGAGDTVISVLGASLAAQCTLSEAVALANFAASLVVGKLGAATVSVPELLAALSGQNTMRCGLVSEEQLLLAVNKVRAQGKRIIFTNGCFDILHVGHVTLLQMAKALGDYLIVAVNTDESIRKLKGANRPINNLDHRMIVLAGLGVVDWVVPFADATPERLLHLLKPDLLVKGGDYSLNQVVGKEIVEAYGGEVRVLNSNITSSTQIINRIISSVQVA